MFEGFVAHHIPAGQLYARAAPRLQAYLRDAFVYVAVPVVCMLVAVTIGTPIATQVNVVAAILFLLLYEPVCIWKAGGTIGHISLNLRVARAEDLGPVSFKRALLRTMVKGVVGVWAFMAIYFTRRCQAVHDLAARTVVIPRDGSTASRTGFAVERRKA